MKKHVLLAILPILLLSCSKETKTEEEPPVIDPEVTYVSASEGVSRYIIRPDGKLTCSLSTLWYTTDFPDAVQVDEYGYILKSDGTVWNLSLSDVTNPVQINGFSGITQISSSLNPGSNGHLLALKNDGTVWAMGANQFGQLGDNTTTASSVPVQVQGLSDVISVSCFWGLSLAVKSDGTVWGWGINGSGSLGTAIADGATTSVPVQIQGLSGIESVSAGSAFAIAKTTSGTVYSWGNNSVGQLGDGTTTARAVPAIIPGLSGVTQISAGHGTEVALEAYAIALKSDGTVWSWGSNANGNIGDGTNTNRLTPVQVNYLSNIQYISATGGSFAIDSEHYLWAWGNNVYGGLGILTTISLGSIYYSPVRVTAN